MYDLGRLGVKRYRIEGGCNVLGQLFDQNRIDELWSFYAPMLTAGDKPSLAGFGVTANELAISLIETKFEHFGDDVLARGYVTPPWGDSSWQMTDSRFVSWIPPPRSRYATR